MDEFDSPWHDTEVMAREDSMRNHPAKGFRLPKYVVVCPRCLRGMRSETYLSRPHWRTTGAKVCSTCQGWERKMDILENQRKEHIQHMLDLP